MEEEAEIFVGGLSSNTMPEHLLKAFQRFRELTEAKVMMDKYTGCSRRFGFVTFTKEQSAKDAISGMHNCALDGRVITVNKAKPKMVGGADVCYECGRHGHRIRECPRLGGGNGGRNGERNRAGSRERFCGDRYRNDKEGNHRRGGGGGSHGRDGGPRGSGCDGGPKGCGCDKFRLKVMVYLY